MHIFAIAKKIIIKSQDKEVIMEDVEKFEITFEQSNKILDCDAFSFKTCCDPVVKVNDIIHKKIKDDYEYLQISQIINISDEEEEDLCNFDFKREKNIRKYICKEVNKYGKPMYINYEIKDSPVYLYDFKADNIVKTIFDLGWELWEPIPYESNVNILVKPGQFIYNKKNYETCVVITSIINDISYSITEYMGGAFAICTYHCKNIESYKDVVIHDIEFPPEGQATEIAFKTIFEQGWELHKNNLQKKYKKSSK